MSLPLIGYDNILEQATITTGEELSGYEAKNIGDWLAYDWYKSSSTGVKYIDISLTEAREVDYIAIHSYSLPNTSILLQYYDDALSAYVTISSVLGNVDGTVVFEKFNTVISAKTFRLRLDISNGIALLGIVSIGKSIELQRGLLAGFTPPDMASENEYVNTKSDTGLLLGRSLIRKSHKTSIKINSLTPEWVRDTWMPFIEHAKLKPFFFAWNYAEFQNEVAFCVSSGKITKPRYENSTHMSASLNVEAWVKS